MTGSATSTASTARLTGVARGLIIGNALRLAAAAGSGVLLAGAFEPVAQPLLTPVALAVLMVSLAGSSLRVAALLGWSFGVVFMASLLWWLRSSIGVEAWVALSMLQGCWFAAAAVGARVVAPLPGSPLWTAGVWCTVEVMRQAWPLGGFPWGRVGHAVVDSPWQALLPYLGVTGTSFVLFLIGSTAAWAVADLSARRGAVLLATLGLSFLPTAAPVVTTSSGSIQVTVVQGSVPGTGTEVVANASQVTRNHVLATLDIAAAVADGSQTRPDLVVWPENSTASDPFEDGDAGVGITAAADALAGVPLLVGAIVDAPRAENVLNQGIVWTDDGPTSSRYTKHHPVPFGEYIPFRPWLAGLSARLDEVPRDMVAGTGSSPLRLGDVEVAAAICFDIAHDDVVGPQVRGGAELVVVQTSNAMFLGTAQLEQQFAITRVRALETGRSIVVASLNGISGVVGPGGEVLERAPERTPEVLDSRVVLSQDLTPAVTLGGVVPWSVVVVTGAGFLTRLGGWARRRGGTTRATPATGRG